MSTFVTEKLSNEIIELVQQKENITALELQQLIASNYAVSITEKSNDENDLEEKIELFLESKKYDNKTTATIDNYRYLLRRFNTYMNKPVKDITVFDLRKFIEDDCKGQKQTTKSTKVANIKNFFKWLYEEEFIEKDITSKLHSVKMPRKLRKSLSYTEIEKIRIACNTARERALFELLLSTGCRISEVINLNKSDVTDFNKGIKIIGKNKKERIIFYNEKTQIYINKYLRERDDTQDALFVSYRRPHQRIKKKALENEISNLAIRTDIDKNIFPHLLRHSFATLGLKSGASLQSIQTLLGHADIKTTQIYAETSEDEINYNYRCKFNF